MKQETKKTIISVCIILAVFVILWTLLYFFMHQAKKEHYKEVSVPSFETALYQTFQKSDVTKKVEKEWILYQLEDGISLYVYEDDNIISKSLLVFDKEVFNQKKHKNLVQSFVKWNASEIEDTDDLLNQLLDINQQKEELLIADVMVGNREFISRIDTEKNKIVFYSYHLNDIVEGEK
ncbi:MAG: hypothetical protein KH135_00965 [Firmicutes bacterium]|nr:hypothetical protein [Bacillota bacterium]